MTITCFSIWMSRMALLALRVLLCEIVEQSKYFDKSPLRYIVLLKGQLAFSVTVVLKKILDS